MARRSRSVMPPQTPHSILLSRASARHSVRTGQPEQSFLALFWAAPRTKSSSAGVSRHCACGAQFWFHVMVYPLVSVCVSVCVVVAADLAGGGSVVVVPPRC